MLCSLKQTAGATKSKHHSNIVCPPVVPPPHNPPYLPPPPCLALPSWNSENYFSSEWKRDTWKIFLSRRIFPGDSRQCPVCCKLTWGESLCSGGWDWGGGDLSIHIIISDTNTPVQLLFTFHQPSIRVIATTK